MAPAKAEEPLAQLLAKIEEGNRETHRRMELVQGALGNMETVVKSVMSEQGDLQKWRPEVEAGGRIEDEGDHRRHAGNPNPGGEV